MYANTFRNPLKSFRWLIGLALVLTLAMMTAGTLLRLNSGAQACPDYPTCYGSFALPADPAQATSMLHRWLAGTSFLALLGALIVAGVHLRAQRGILIATLTATALFAIQIPLGAILVLGMAAQMSSALHFLLSMLALGALTAAFALTHQISPAPTHALRFTSPFARLTLWSNAAGLALLTSGALVSALDAGKACAEFPVCLPTEPLGWLALVHRALMLITGTLVSVQFVLAWRSQRSQTLTLPAVTAGFILFFGQGLMGALMVLRNFPVELVGVHALATAGWIIANTLSLLAVGLAGRTAEDESLETRETLPLRERLGDFYRLNKPIIVLLLLVTTYAGMVVGGKRLPSLELTFWTMLGGALAAGGASALNQYIDREVDKAMQRTAKRPIPSGRMKPAEGLAYGIAACLAAFFLLAGFVNLLAALLSLAGMVYYVILYSLWLKHATVQNIVIGGGAGAIPPLVGWAAATGSLNIPSLFLFAIIFFWTPPHFWALALVRRNDYARGGVPMLPVVRGEMETRKQVFIYTLELVGLTLLIPLFNLGGSIYLISALVLGLWLIGVAWRVLKQGGNKIAWTMYRTSSMYLAFLFLAMVIDVLV
ncbi:MULTISPECIES: heme o synthase [Anaerolinea]|uniref:heme o synthase n=1 Tax=Anaerolinea TaxID=233189 RepID=UPI00263701C4|nr:heme o synthase [Anaerolinea thermophila]